MTVLRLALITTLVGLSLAACAAPYGPYYSSYGGSNYYYPGNDNLGSPLPAGPRINGSPQNPGSGGGA